MSAADVIRRKAKSYMLTRKATPTIIDGISTPGTPTTSTIKAVHLPMTAKELRNLPPGQNAGEWRNIWSKSELKLTDKINITGLVFTIQRVSLWQDGPFYIANASRTEDTLT